MRTRHRVLRVILALLLPAHVLSACGPTWEEDVSDLGTFLDACPSAAPTVPSAGPVVPLAATEPGTALAPHLRVSGERWELDEHDVAGATHIERLGTLSAALREIDARWSLLHPSTPRSPVTLGVSWPGARVVEVVGILEALSGRRVDLLVDTIPEVRCTAAISGAPAWALLRAASVTHAAPSERVTRLRPDIARAAWGCPALVDALMEREAAPLFRAADWAQHDAAIVVGRCGPGTSDPRALAALLSALLPTVESRVLPLELAPDGQGAFEVVLGPDATFDDLVHRLATAPLRSEHVRVRWGSE